MPEGFLEVLRFEINSILEDRRFFLGIVLQVVLVAALVPVLVDYAERVSGGGDVLSARARGFAPVGIWGKSNSSLEGGLRQMDRLRVERVASEDEAMAGLESGRFCMVLGIPISASQDILVFVNQRDPRSIPAWTTLEVISNSFGLVYRRNLVENTLTEHLSRTSNLTAEEIKDRVESLADIYIEPIRLVVSPVHKEDELPVNITIDDNGGSDDGVSGDGGNGLDRDGDDLEAYLGEGGFLSFVFLSFGLCFPLLSGSGILMESITGEKERRTLEGILGSCASRSGILLGKFTSAFLVSILPSFVLLVVLGQIIRIDNMMGVALCLLISGAGILSAATIVSVVCKNSKEANLAVTIVYVFIFVIFFGPLMIPGQLAWISPFTPMVRLAAGETVDLGSALAPLLATAIFSVISVLLCAALLQRDDFVFGPRPSIQRFLRDELSVRTTSFRSQVVLVATMGVLATVPAIVFPGLFLLPSFAFLGGGAVIAVLVFAAFVEEYFKPYGVYILSTRPSLRELIMLGAVAGLSFSLIENILFTWALYGSGALQGPMLLVRYVLAPIVHVSLTILVVVGHSKGRLWKFSALAIASIIHALYNLMAILSVM